MKTAVGVSLAFALAGVGFAQAPPHTMFVKSGRLIFDTTQAPMDRGEIIITNGTVTAVGANLAQPAGSELVDLSADTVMPSLLDAHTHIAAGAFGASPSYALAALMGSRDVAYARESGVAAMRVLGTDGFIDVALGDAIDQGAIPGPHIIPAAHAISIPGGHADFLTLPPQFPLDDYYNPLHGFINSVADAEKAVHLQVKYGAKVIKIMASGGVLSPTDQFSSEQLSPAEMATIVQVAHGDHLKVAAHDENLQAILDALHAGIDSCEHCSDLDQEALDYMKAHHQVMDATIYVVDNLLANGARMHMPEYTLRKAHELATKHMASFQLALRSGVIMDAGSDQSYAPGTGTIYNEVVSEVNHGATPQQALTAATKNNAALLELDQLGTLAVGKEGDLVAMTGNPLADINAVSHLTTVVYQGKVVKPSANQ
ncbi:MAG TPA: amidohydrolase family protein [Terriglobales bacterium]|nr:amidohydrolase family protein [Terriglobales bacterium]